MKKRKGFLDGRGGELPSGSILRPSKEANAEGVREVASTGMGRPVIFAKRVRIQRIMVNIPRMDPRLLRKFPSCSATDTIALIVSKERFEECFDGSPPTKKTGVCGHVCALKHLSKSSKCTNYTFNYLESSLCALREALR